MFKTTIKVKQETRKKLKLYAAEHGITMDEAINKLLPLPTRKAPSFSYGECVNTLAEVQGKRQEI